MSPFHTVLLLNCRNVTWICSGIIEKATGKGIQYFFFVCLVCELRER